MITEGTAGNGGGPWHRRAHWRILMGMLAGVGFGVLSVALGWNGFVEAWVAPFGEIFLRLLKLSAVPLVVTSLVCGVASLSDARRLSHLGVRTIVLYLVTTAVAVTLGLLVADLARPGAGLSADVRDRLIGAYGDGAAPRRPEGPAGPLGPLVAMFPENFFGAASANSAMLQVVIVSLLLGVVMLQIDRAKAAPVLAFFGGLNEAVLAAVGLVMRVAPIGVFGLMASMVSVAAGDDPGHLVEIVGSLGRYCVAVLAALAVHVALVYLPLLRFLAGRRAGEFFSGAAPAQLVAFSTSSSYAALPVTLRCCEKRLGVSEGVAGFVVSLGATVNMDGSAIHQAVATTFIAQAAGVKLGVGEHLTILLMVLLSSVGTAGVPSVGLVMLVMILESVGLPVGGVALILGVDRILDMVRTTVNVTGDMVVATVVGRYDSREVAADGGGGGGGRALG